MERDVAVDSHRKTIYVVIADRAGHELLRRRLPATRAGEAELLALLEKGDRVVLEATTGAHRLANRLEHTGAQVRLIDPQQARLVGMRGKKTDYRDCRALLQLLRADTLVDVWRPDVQTRVLRQLTRERFAYNQSIVRLKNRIRALLWEEGVDTPSNLWSRDSEQWLSEQPLSAPVRRILQREWLALQGLEALKSAQEEELALAVVDRVEAQRLLQIAGFGPAAAAMFLGEVGAVGRFSSAKQLVSYAGLDPRVHQSGERYSGAGVSKAGRSLLRWLLVEIAWTHVRVGGPEAPRFHRLVAKGKPENVAITALARQLLVLAYQLLSRQENYRQLAPAQYERKLARLAACRPPSANPQVTDVDWAAARLEELIGCASPYRQAHPRARPGAARIRKRIRRSEAPSQIGPFAGLIAQAGAPTPASEGKAGLRISPSNTWPGERSLLNEAGTGPHV